MLHTSLSSSGGEREKSGPTTATTVACLQKMQQSLKLKIPLSNPQLVYPALACLVSLPVITPTVSSRLQCNWSPATHPPLPLKASTPMAYVSLCTVGKSGKLFSCLRHQVKATVRPKSLKVSSVSRGRLWDDVPAKLCWACPLGPGCRLEALRCPLDYCKKSGSKC